MVRINLNKTGIEALSYGLTSVIISVLLYVGDHNILLSFGVVPTIYLGYLFKTYGGHQNTDNFLRALAYCISLTPTVCAITYLLLPLTTLSQLYDVLSIISICIIFVMCGFIIYSSTVESNILDIDSN